MYISGSMYCANSEIVPLRFNPKNSTIFVQTVTSLFSVISAWTARAFKSGWYVRISGVCSSTNISSIFFLWKSDFRDKSPWALTTSWNFLGSIRSALRWSSMNEDARNLLYAVNFSVVFSTPSVF